MSEELNPCPFCGSATDPALSSWDNDCGEPDADGGFHVICCAIYRNQGPFGGCGASICVARRMNAGARTSKRRAWPGGSMRQRAGTGRSQRPVNDGDLHGFKGSEWLKMS